MNLPDFSDPAVDRKLSFQIAQRGCGLHRERFLCLFDMGESETMSENLNQLFLDLAKIHYEADFAAGSSAETISVKKETADDNCYFIESLTDELRAYLHFKSRIIVTEEDLITNGAEAVKSAVVDALKHERFKRDETTKVAYFKITPSRASK